MCTKATLTSSQQSTHFLLMLTDLTPEEERFHTPPFEHLLRPVSRSASTCWQPPGLRRFCWSETVCTSMLRPASRCARWCSSGSTYTGSLNPTLNVGRVRCSRMIHSRFYAAPVRYEAVPMCNQSVSFQSVRQTP